MNRVYRFMLIAACFFGAGSLSAHLLNMTQVQLLIDQEGKVEVEVKVDLSKELETPDAYYAFSQLDSEAAMSEQDELWSILAESIDIRINAQSLPLKVTSVLPPEDASKKNFENPFIWPRTQVALSGHIPSIEGTMQVTFLPQMNFEEPIALTMRSAITGKSKSRWLVASQSSPLFIVNREVPDTIAADANEAPTLEVFSNYVRLGFLHILPGGWDHLLFVLGIFLAASNGRQLLLQVSVFTVAHTLTLGLASYRIIEPPVQLIELLIALSILWIGVENTFRFKHPKTRLALIGAFGLLHGMGFASALSGLMEPQADFLLSLFAFNIGVELGQLSFLILLFMAVAWFRKRPWYHRRIVLPVSLSISMVALFWVVQRF